MGFGVRLAKRCIGFSKSYIAICAILALYAIGLANLPEFLALTNLASLPANVGADMTTLFPYLSIAMIALSGLVVSTPVLLLFVYDKNNGVLEYLLSTGMDQIDLFSAYLRAALVLSSIALLCVNSVNTLIGLVLGTSAQLLLVLFVLSFVIGLSAVSFVTVSMIAFSSLQKTPMGANQPLGLAMGMIPIFPLFVLPMVFLQYVFLTDVALAITVAMVSMTLLVGASRLVIREKLLP
jgi:hypothetical protein